MIFLRDRLNNMLTNLPKLLFKKLFLSWSVIGFSVIASTVFIPSSIISAVLLGTINHTLPIMLFTAGTLSIGAGLGGYSLYQNYKDINNNPKRMSLNSWMESANGQNYIANTPASNQSKNNREVPK